MVDFNFEKEFSKKQASLQPIFELIDKLNSVESTNRELQKQFCNVKSSLDTAETQIKRLESSQNFADPEANAKNRELEEKVRSLQDELLSIHKNRADNSAELLMLKDAIVEANSKNEILTKDLSKANTEILKLTRELDNVKNSKNKLDKQLNDLNDEMIAQNMAHRKVEAIKTQLEVDYDHAVRENLKYKQMQADFHDNEGETFKQMKAYKAEVERLRKQIKAGPSALLAEFEIPDLDDDGREVTNVPTAGSIPSKLLKNHQMDSDVHSIIAVQGNYAVGLADSSVRVFKNNHASVATFTDSSGTVNCLDFSHDCRYLLDASNDYACKIWRMDSKRCIATLTGHCGKVFAAKFLPQESNLRVVSGSSDRTVRLFDLNSQTTLKTYMVSSAVQDLSVIEKGEV